MKLRLLAPSDAPDRPDLLVALAFDGTKPKITPALDAAIKQAKSTGDLETGFRKASLFHRTDRSGPKRLLFLGMGKRSDIATERLRRIAALAQQQAESIGTTEFQLWINDADHKSLSAEDAGRAIAEGLILGSYVYKAPSKSKADPRKAQRAAVVYAGSAAARRDFTAGFKVGVSGAEATSFARDLANKAGNACTPTYLANQAKKLAATAIKVRVLDEREMARLKMGALLGVSKGSAEPAKLILLDHKPANHKRTVCVVGKGLTFDTGGISIKPSSKMDEMRYDMCGGAAVLGLFHAIKSGALRGASSKTRVVGVVAASENLPDAKAQKPGDVVTACDGTTIEVLNTDAEGRLILADALAYALKTYKPDHMVDLATLTGAVVVALGHEAAGVMGNDDELIEALIDAGKRADEPLWQLPLWDCHKDQMKSKFADLHNINSPGQGNGSIAGGAFLSNFVGDTSWAHCDIAGSAWGALSKDYYRSGATGTAVRMLVQWVRSLG